MSQGPAEAAFDMEIGVYDPHKRSFIQSSMNSHMRLSSGTPAKLEYASLSFLVKEEHLEKPLYIFFRALNFTDDGTGHKANEGCLTLYMRLNSSSTYLLVALIHPSQFPMKFTTSNSLKKD